MIEEQSLIIFTQFTFYSSNFQLQINFTREKERGNREGEREREYVCAGACVQVTLTNSRKRLISILSLFLIISNNIQYNKLVY